MNAERKLKLHDELHEARLERRTAIEAMNEARSTYLDKKAKVRAATDTVEEILEEIETGKTKRPLIDHINGDGRSFDPITLRPLDEVVPAADDVPAELEPEAPKKGRRKKEPM